jgi:uncharacterized linocin/CFP29 family protein
MMNIDFIGNGQAQGEVAGLLANGALNPNKMRPFLAKNKQGKVGAYISVFKGGDAKKPENYSIQPVTNATLRRDEWKQLDDALLRVQRERLTGFDDLQANGLVYNLNNGIGTTVLEHHKISDAMSAELSMDGKVRGQNDRPDYKTEYLPIPIVHVDYEINMRALEASRSLGNPLDISSAESAVRRIREKLDDMLFTDTSYAFGGGTIYSYLNHPDRNEVTLSTAWDASGKSAGDIVDDVVAMKQASIDAKHYGPWVIYIPTSYETVLDEDYDTNGQSTQTIRERILKISGIQDIKVADRLADDNVVMVQMTSNVVRIVNGMPIQNVEWKSEGQFVGNYKVMTIQVPQIRSDYNGNTGLVHLA